MVREDAVHVDVGNITIDLTRRGHGPDEVVLLHASPFQCWYRPLLDRLGTVPNVAVLTYRRTVSDQPFALDADTDAILIALQRAGAERVHVVGHSWGGILALELARRAPAAVRSLALLEPAGTAFLDEEQTRAAFEPLIAKARADGPDAAIRAFLDMVLGDSGADLLERHVPGAAEEATAWAEPFFRAEMPALIPWTYGADDAAAVRAPVLLVAGTESVPRFKTSGQLLTEWFPSADRLELEGVGHLLMAGQPDQVAAALRAFWVGVDRSAS